MHFPWSTVVQSTALIHLNFLLQFLLAKSYDLAAHELFQNTIECNGCSVGELEN